ncbi:MAG: MATE family efflux transporter, partial [Candidatus Muirbacterium halophilum]|nr:MATE family efflux transporter [Candidatus Muirbacterium halophilum]
LGFVFALLFYVFGENIAGIFNKDKEVVKYIVMYLTIVPISYSIAGTIMISNSVLNVFKKSVQASALSLTQMFILYIPLAYFLSGIFNVKGIFIALALTFIISGIAGLLFVKKYYLKLSEI